MVTADGTYVSQSALSTATVRKEEKMCAENKIRVLIAVISIHIYFTFVLISINSYHQSLSLSLSPPIRQYLLDGKFFVAGVIASTLTKLTIRLLSEVKEPLSRNVS